MTIRKLLARTALAVVLLPLAVRVQAQGSDDGTDGRRGRYENGYDEEGRRWSVSTNLADWADLITMNISSSASFARRSTLGVTLKYNPWMFNHGTEKQVNHNVRSVSVDYRFYPWYVYSGWWIMARAQACEYNVGNLFGRKFSEQGHAVGGGIGFGYEYMLFRNVNIDFGISGWAGYKWFKKYDCAFCGYPTEDGHGPFLRLDNVFVSLNFVF